MMQLPNKDTIVALSTAPGLGAIAVIRLSGRDAISIVDRVFHGKILAEQDSHTLHFGTIKKGNEVIDEVVIGLFKAPHSYTKEHVVEISCHGSPYIQQRIIELLIEEGARLAKPGEFTMRAFLNGQMDLSQAEAVADLIAANSESAHHLALQQMRGGYSGKIAELREKLVHFASMIELELDFAEEDVEFADRDDLKALIHEIQILLQKLIHSFQLGNVLKNGVSTVIAGRPNAGKSTLLNALVQEERAIVSDIPGTTRDTIEEVLNIEGIQFRLIDTAGIRDATDKIEQMGVQRTMEKIGQSSIVVYVFDVEQMNEKVLREDLEKIQNPEIPIIIVGNKSDLLNEAELKEKFAGLKNIIFLSSREEQNVDALITALLANVEHHEEGGVVVSNVRHYQALKRANDSLNEVLQGLDNNISGELLALDIRRGLEALGEITGEVTTDDLLGNIFSKFCIGK